MVRLEMLKHRFDSAQSEQLSIGESVAKELIERHKDALPWQVESTRLTAFPARGSEIDYSGWWQYVVRSEPESKIDEPQKRTHRQQGSFGEGLLTLRIQHDRVDWVYGLLPGKAVREPGISTIGTLDDVLGRIRGLSANWFKMESLPPITRLALGLVLVATAPSKEAAEQALLRQLRVIKIDPGEATDIGFQVNRPRFSSVIEGLRVNRLTKWSTVYYTIAELNVSGTLETQRIPASQLEIDVNSDAAFQGNLPKDRLGALLEEFAQLAEEIATTGDVP